jgi:stress-induced morphogen
LTELQAAHVECNDVSDGSCGGGAKLELIVVTEKFEGLPLLKRHRLVNDCLAEYMPQIHAITMKTWTPKQYESKK